MYTKSQFNQLLKTRKHWTGKQLGRLIIQTGIETLNGKEPVTTSEVITPLVQQLTSSKDIEDYTMYANIHAGMTSAWNFVEAVGNEAIANLTYIRSIISRLRDFSSAELTNRQRPVMITQAEYQKYKYEYNKAWKEHKEYMLNRKITLGELLIDSISDKREDDINIHVYGPNATKVINQYKNKFFSKEDISLLRDFMQEHHVTYKYDSEERWEAKEIIREFKELKYFEYIDHDTKAFLIACYLKKSCPVGQEEFNEYAKQALKKYISLVESKQLELIYSSNLTFDKALLTVLKEYPFKFMKHPDERLKELPNTVPYVPDKLSYADLLFTNKETSRLSIEFWQYTYRGHDNPDTRYDKFIQDHFMEFIKASKKDLIQKYPKMSNKLDKVTNSTSFIIPQFTFQTLATAGFKVFQDLTSDEAISDDIRFIDMFPENRRKQVQFAGYAIYHNDAYTPYHSDVYTPDLQKKRTTHLDKVIGDDWFSAIQHYDILNFVPNTFKYNEKKLKEAFDSLAYYMKVQATYEDYFKGLARIMDDTSFRKFNRTTAYSSFLVNVEDYKKDILSLLEYLSQIIDGHEAKTKTLNAIKTSLPMVQTSYPNYKHKTIKELAELLEQSYRTPMPVSVMNIFNDISEGAD